MSEPVEITVEVKEFNRAIKEYEKAVTNHDLAYILNRAGRNVATKASHNTPKASLATIDAELDRVGYKQGYGPAVFALTNWKRAKKGLLPVGGMAMSEPAKDFRSKRHSGRGYIAAGWTPAIIRFGGHTRAHIAESSKINRAQNKLASAGDLVAILENTARGAGEVGAQALEKAIVETSRDMIAFAEKKLDDTSKKYSAK